MTFAIARLNGANSVTTSSSNDAAPRPSSVRRLCARATAAMRPSMSAAKAPGVALVFKVCVITEEMTASIRLAAVCV